jgi:hypothetical protein
MSGGKGIPKTKWSEDEEKALKAGVDRCALGLMWGVGVYLNDVARVCLCVYGCVCVCFLLCVGYMGYFMYA